MSAAEIIREAHQGDACKLASKTLGEKVHLQTSSDIFAQPSDYKKDGFGCVSNSSKVSQKELSTIENVETANNSNTSGPELKDGGITPSSSFHGKRKLSLSVENNNKKVPKKRRKTVEKSNVRSVKKFLLGGNRTDPLNLNSLVDEEVSKIANAQTPISSPLPERNKDPDPVIVPQDLRDPLKLNSDTDESNPSLTKVVVRKRKRRNSFRNPTADDTSFEEDTKSVQRNSLEKETLTIDVRPHQAKHPIVDKIVSPVIPEACRKRKHKRKSDPSPTVSKVLLTDEEGKPYAPVKAKDKKNDHKSPEKARGSCSEEVSLPKFRDKGEQYQYGNYVGYYGYRNANQKDVRLTYFRQNWFEGKTCLDIGCNTGHVTLYVAKTFQPTKIVGMDIDAKLINLARKSVRQCLEDMLKSKGGFGGGKFPVSMKKCYGALPALQTVPQLQEGNSSSAKKTQDLFPGNVLFRCVSTAVK